MLKFIQQLIDLNSALVAKARSATIYDEALALHGAKEYSKAFPVMKEAASLGSFALVLDNLLARSHALNVRPHDGSSFRNPPIRQQIL